METIKIVFSFLLSVIGGFGFWYLIFWFVSSEPNLFMWGPWTKGFYLFFGFTSTGQILEKSIK